VGAILTNEQVERTLALCEGIRSRPGMYISRFDWHTVDAFWQGYFSAMGDDVLECFWSWGLSHLGEPGASVDPIQLLRRRHGQPSDDLGNLTRQRVSEITELICAVVMTFVTDHRE
jgi:hypothetical protein